MRSSNKLTRLSIAIGTKCNFNCGHCTISNTDKGVSLTQKEIRTLRAAVRDLSPKRMLFTGGEPTLYIKDINEILSAHPDLEKCAVIVTTNAHFGKSEEACRKVLSSFKRITGVQVSYDKFHAKFSPLSNLANVSGTAKKMGLTCTVLLAVQSPFDFAILEEIKKIGKLPVCVQRVLPLGEAKRNDVAFVHPALDPTIFRRKCQNRSQMTYMCGKGFSWCCSELLFNNPHMKFAHRTIKGQLGSRFYKLIRNNTFGQLMRRFNISKDGLLPAHSEPCVICNYIFEEAGKKGLLNRQE